MDPITAGIVASIVGIPALLAKNYLLEMNEDEKIFQTRMFDDDNNPKTGQAFRALNPNVGYWGDGIVKEYCWNRFNPAKRIVKVVWDLGNGKGQPEDIPYSVWKTIRKGPLVVELTEEERGMLGHQKLIDACGNYRY